MHGSAAVRCVETLEGEEPETVSADRTLGVVSAGADEFHQLFVPGRYGCFADVVLDTCGGAFGLLVCVCVEKIVRRRKQKRKDKEKEITL